MATCPPRARDAVQRDLHSAWAQINSATVDDAARAASWRQWNQYTAEARVEPYMRTSDRHGKQQLFLAFAARVRTGFFGKKRQVGYQSVEKALRHVAQTFVLAGYADPRRSHGSHELDLAFRHLLKKMKDEDPAPRPQVALPVPTIMAAAILARPEYDPRTRAIADLVAIAFFFLLRVGEYTMPAAHRRTRTVQFRVQDVRFWSQGQLVPHTAGLNVLLQADSATLYIDNQKNGQRGSTLHHEAKRSPGSLFFCPVKSLARRVHAIVSHGMPPETPLSYLSLGRHVVASDILSAVRSAATRTGLLQNGYKLDRIGAHSLRASGAMALKLTGTPSDTIKKVGRWTSDTFLTYIHAQIGALHAGLAEQMSRPIFFLNIGG